MSSGNNSVTILIISVCLFILAFLSGYYYHKAVVAPIILQDTLFKDTGSIVIKERPIEIITKSKTVTKWDTLIFNSVDTIYTLKTINATVDTAIRQTIEVVYKDTVNNVNDTVNYQNSLWFYVNYRFPENIMTVKHKRLYDTLNLYSFTKIKYYDTSKDDFTNQTWFKVGLAIVSFGSGVYVGSFK